MEFSDNCETMTIGVPRQKSRNRVSTTKYSVLTFLPRFLFEQFQNLVNIFFLAISAIQLFPGLSPLGEHGTIVPLCLILMVAAVKEIYEDMRRFFSDRQVNNRLVLAFVPELGWQPMQWHKLKVGQVVKVAKGEHIPADLVILSSSEPAAMAYIETANLDGESNLKIRQALSATANCVTDADIVTLVNSNVQIRCELPNCRIYDFTGVMISPQQPTTQGIVSGISSVDVKSVTHALSSGHLLPRGARLKNTDWIYGVIVYAGKQTKLMLNTTRTPTKRSYVDSMTNTIMTMNFGILLFLCAGAALMSVWFVFEYRHAAWYLGYPVDGPVEDSRSPYFFYVLAEISMLNGIMPISLYVTLEMIRLMQASFIENDMEMYDAESDSKALVRRSTLNETLGQVRYVLSDKTGTLTENRMVFKMCSVGGRCYGDKDAERFRDLTLLQDLRRTTAGKPSKHAKTLRDYLTLLSVCHTVVPESRAKSENSPDAKTASSQPSKTTRYHASSPDEAALVRFARSCGFVFDTRTPESVVVEIQGHRHRFDVLAVLEFTSDRKRMGVVVRTSSGKIKLFVKGADSTILPRLSAECDRDIVVATLNHLRQFANLGYRTLCVAMRDIPEAEYLKWEPAFYTASTALTNRRTLIDEQAELIEKDLRLLGVTAIEDKLQEGVTDTIVRMTASDIRVWILTGDKLETAINIGHSSGLIHSQMTTFVLTPKSDAETASQMVGRVVCEIETTLNATDRLAALIIDGSVLHKLMEEGITYEFVHLALSVGCVICCRCTPRQKAAMVRLVRKHIDGATLAIGDGANDVAMIQAADVGIGISGEEGMQASLAADYSIGKFRFLQRLLFVHGTLSHVRTVKTIYFSFYKNVAEIVCLLMFYFFTGYSDTPSLDPNSVVLYNLCFTSWPCLVLGAFDKPTSLLALEHNPKLYRLSQDRSTFSIKHHVWAMFMATVHAALLYGLMLGAYHHEMLWSDGHVGGVYTFGNFVMTALVVFVNAKFLLDLDSVSVVALFSTGTSIFWYLLFVFIYGSSYHLAPNLIQPDMVDALWLLFTTPSAACAIVLAVTTPLVIELSRKAIVRTVIVRGNKDRVPWQETKIGDMQRIMKPIKKVYGRLRPNRTVRQQSSYAFSQEENPAVSQADVIRAYDSRFSKKPGTPAANNSDRSFRFSNLKKPSSNTATNTTDS